MKKSNYKWLSVVILLAALYLTGCVSSPNDATASGSAGQIEVYTPKSNDTIDYKGSEVTYSLIPASGVNFIQVYVDGEFVESFSPGYYAYPVVKINLDSSYIGNYVDYYLVYYDNNGTTTQSKTMKDIYVSELRTPPSTPFGVNASLISETMANISWSDTSVSNAYFEIYRQAGFNEDFVPHLVSAPGTFNINDENLNPDVIYFYKVRSVNKYGTSLFSSVVNTGGVGGSLNVPPPSNLTATALNSNTIQLNWKDNSSNENFFKVERKLTWGSFQSIATVSKNTVQYTDSSSGIYGGAEYYYRIKAYSNTDSSWSNTVYVKTSY